MIFADDTQIYFQCSPSDLDYALTLVNREMGVIANYATARSLSRNSMKCKIMILGINAYVRSFDFASLPQAIISKTIVSFVQGARHAGVHVSSNLSLRKHVSFIWQNVHASLHRLKYHRNSLFMPLRIKLVAALIFSYLDYCCTGSCTLGLEEVAKVGT